MTTVKQVLNCWHRDTGTKTTCWITGLNSIRQYPLHGRTTTKSTSTLQYNTRLSQRLDGEKEDIMKEYILEHNMGEMSFETARDAILAMYLVADYDKDCNCEMEFTRTKAEIDRITRKIEAGEYYTNGILALFVSQ